jgi:predicted Zn-dependent protease
MMGGVRWAEAEATMALGTLEYHSLRRQEARVDSVLKQVLRTSRDPFLVARFAEEMGKRTALRVPGRSGRLPQDVLKDEVERLLANGLIGAARNKVSAPSVEVEPWLLTMLGSKIAVAEGDMVRAVALASRAVAQSGGTDASRWELVKVLSQSSHTREALREAGKLVERRPADPAVRLLRAQTLLDAGLPYDALTDLEQAELLGGEAMACGIARSQALRMIGDGAGAERVLVELLAARPGTSWPAYELASWAEEEGRIADAIKWARQAVSRAPADHGSRVLLGRVLIRAGMVAEGRHHLDLVTKDPRAGPGWQTDARREMERLKGGGG